MDSILRFGNMDKPRCFFLDMESGQRFIIHKKAFLVRRSNFDPRLFIGTAKIFHYENGVLHLYVFIDEEQMTDLEVATVPNCDGIHKWISQTNRLLAHRQD